MHPFLRRAIPIVSLGLLVLAPSSLVTAASDKVAVENLRGPLVNASFSSTDPSGCIEVGRQAG